MPKKTNRPLDLLGAIVGFALIIFTFLFLIIYFLSNALNQFWPDLFFIFFELFMLIYGIFFIIHGILGLVDKNIVMGYPGYLIPFTTYKNKSAVFVGLCSILFGVSLIIIVILSNLGVFN